MNILFWLEVKIICQNLFLVTSSGARVIVCGKSWLAPFKAGDYSNGLAATWIWLHAESLSDFIRTRPDVVAKCIFSLAGDWPSVMLELSDICISFCFHPREKLQYEQIMFCHGLIAIFSFLFNTAIWFLRK